MPDFEHKICTRDQLAARVAALPKPVVLTNGVFDILHRGHVTYLAQARALGASLVVAANTDASVKRLGKGDDRPLNNCDDRMALLAALESVSLVVDFDEDTALAVVQQARPDIYAKGGDYQMDAIPEVGAGAVRGAPAVAARRSVLDPPAALPDAGAAAGDGGAGVHRRFARHAQSGRAVCRRHRRGDQGVHARRRNRHAHRVRTPAVQHLGGAAADASLARAHAAARLQLGAAPAGVHAQFAVAYVLAAAHDGVAGGQRGHFRPQRKCARQARGEFLPPVARPHRRLRRFFLAAGHQPGDASLGQRQVHAADARAFAGAIDAREGGLLPRVGADHGLSVARGGGAADRLRQFQVGQQAVAAGQVVAFHGVRIAPFSMPDLHRGQSGVAVRGLHIAVVQVRYAAQPGAQAQRLRHFRRRGRQRRRKAQQRGQRRLFDDGDDVRAARLERGRHRQQQRAAARHHHLFSGHRVAALGQRLQAAGARHAGQGPAGEGQQALARSRRQHQALVMQRVRGVGRLHLQLSGRERIQHARLRQEDDVMAIGQRLPQVLRARVVLPVRPAAPDLAAGQGIVIHDGHRLAAGRRRVRGRQSGGAGADHQHVVNHGALPVSTCMPDEHSVWHASRCGRPSMVTRHSWHTPMPHKGARGAPVTERRVAMLPAMAMAAATVTPASTRTGCVSMWSSMLASVMEAVRQIRFIRNARAFALHLRGQQLRRGQRRGDAQPFVAGGQPQAAPRCRRADQRQAVRRGRAQAGPAAQHVQLSQRRRKSGRVAQHLAQHVGFDLWVDRVELARGTDQDLAGGARLQIEGHRIAAGRMRALDVPEFHQLVMHETRIAVGDGDVSLLGLHGQLRQQRLRAGAGSEHDALRLVPRAVGQHHRVVLDGSDGRAPGGGAAAHGAIEQDARALGRIHQAVAVHQQAARQAGAQLRLARVQLRRRQHVAGQVEGGHGLRLGARRVQLFLVGGHPDGAAVAVFVALRAVAHQVAPQRYGVRRQRQRRPRCRRRRRSRRHGSPDAPDERIGGVEDQLRLGVHPGLAADAGNERAVTVAVRAFEHAADHAFLAPQRAFGQLAVGRQAGQLGAGAGAARRAVVGLAGAQHKTLAVGARARGREQFDMVDRRAVVARDAGLRQGRAHGRAVRGQRFHVVHGDVETMVGSEKEPVAAVSHIARHRAVAGHLHRHRVLGTARGHVGDGDAAVVVQLRFHHAHGRIDAVQSRRDASHECERGHQADGAVAAHAQVADVVKKDDAGHAVRRMRFAQQGAHQHIGAARLAHHRRAEVVVILPEAHDPLGQRAVAQVRAAGRDQPRGFAARVGVDDGDGVVRGVMSIHAEILGRRGAAVLHRLSTMDDEIRTIEKKRQTAPGAAGTIVPMPNRPLHDGGDNPARRALGAGIADPFFAEALFDALPDVVFFVKDGQGRYVVVNQTLVQRCGQRHKAALIGRTPAEPRSRLVPDPQDGAARRGRPHRGPDGRVARPGHGGQEKSRVPQGGRSGQPDPGRVRRAPAAVGAGAHGPYVGGADRAVFFAHLPPDAAPDDHQDAGGSGVPHAGRGCQRGGNRPGLRLWRPFGVHAPVQGHGGRHAHPVPAAAGDDGIVFLRRDHAHAHAHRHHAERRGGVGQPEVRHRFADQVRHRQRIVLAVRLRDDGEFLAAVARHHVAAAADAARQFGRHLAQDVVAGLVAVAIVVLLEHVHVEHGQRERLAGAARAAPFRRQHFVEAAAVGDAGQAVGGADCHQAVVRFLQFAGALAHPLFQLALARPHFVDEHREADADHAQRQDEFLRAHHAQVHRHIAERLHPAGHHEGGGHGNHGHEQGGEARAVAQRDQRDHRQQQGGRDGHPVDHAALGRQHGGRHQQGAAQDGDIDAGQAQARLAQRKGQQQRRENEHAQTVAKPPQSRQRKVRRLESRHMVQHGRSRHAGGHGDQHGTGQAEFEEVLDAVQARRSAGAHQQPKGQQHLALVDDSEHQRHMQRQRVQVGQHVGRKGEGGQQQRALAAKAQDRRQQHGVGHPEHHHVFRRDGPQIREPDAGKVQEREQKAEQPVGPFPEFGLCGAGRCRYANAPSTGLTLDHQPVRHVHAVAPDAAGHALRSLARRVAHAGHGVRLAKVDDDAVRVGAGAFAAVRRVPMVGVLAIDGVERAAVLLARLFAVHEGDGPVGLVERLAVRAQQRQFGNGRKLLAVERVERLQAELAAGGRLRERDVLGGRAALEFALVHRLDAVELRARGARWPWQVAVRLQPVEDRRFEPRAAGVLRAGQVQHHYLVGAAPDPGPRQVHGLRGADAPVAPQAAAVDPHDALPPGGHVEEGVPRVGDVEAGAPEGRTGGATGFPRQRRQHGVGVEIDGANLPVFQRLPAQRDRAMHAFAVVDFHAEVDAGDGVQQDFKRNGFAARGQVHLEAAVARVQRAGQLAVHVHPRQVAHLGRFQHGGRTGGQRDAVRDDAAADVIVLDRLRRDGLDDLCRQRGEDGRRLPERKRRDGDDRVVGRWRRQRLAGQQVRFHAVPIGLEFFAHPACLADRRIVVVAAGVGTERAVAAAPQAERGAAVRHVQAERTVRLEHGGNVGHRAGVGAALVGRAPGVEPSRVIFAAHARAFLHLVQRLEAGCRIAAEVRHREQFLDVGLDHGVGGIALEQRHIETAIEQHLAHGAHVVEVLAEEAVFVFDLHHQDRTAVRDLLPAQHPAHFLHPAPGRGHIALVAGAQEAVAGMLEQPPGQAAHFPLGARVRAGTQNHPQAFLLRQAAEFHGIALAGPVVFPFAPFVVIPEQVGAHGIEAHGLDGLEAVAPVFARHAGKMHFAAADLDPFAVEREVGVGDGKARRGGGLHLRRDWRHRHHGQQRAAHGGAGAAQHAASVMKIGRHLSSLPGSLWGSARRRTPFFASSPARARSIAQLRLVSHEADGQIPVFREIAGRGPYGFMHRLQRGAHLALGQAGRELLAQRQQGQRLERRRAVGERAADGREAAVGRNKALQVLAVALHAPDGLRPQFFRLAVPERALFFVQHVEDFHQHRVHDKGVVVIEVEGVAVLDPAVAHVPLVDLADGDVHAQRVEFFADRHQPRLVHGREQHPVDVRRLDAAQRLDLGNDAGLGLGVQRLPQRFRCADQGIREVGGIDQRLARSLPQQVVGTGGIDRVGIALQRQLVQALAGFAFGRAVVRQGQPRRDAGNQAPEAFEVRHALVAAIPGFAPAAGLGAAAAAWVTPSMAPAADPATSDCTKLRLSTVSPFCVRLLCALFMLSDLLAQQAHHLRRRQQVRAHAERRGGILVHHLAWNGAFADRLDVAYLAIGLQRNPGQIMPALAHHGQVFVAVKYAVIDAPCVAVHEERGAAGFRSRRVCGVEQAAGPVAVRRLHLFQGRRHVLELGDVLGAVRVVGRQVLQHLGQARKHPAVAARPEVLLAVGAPVFRVHVARVAVVQLFLAVVHDAVRVREVLVQLGQVLAIARDGIELGHHRHHHVQAVRPPPVIVLRGAHLVFHHLAGTGDLARIFLRIEPIQVRIGLERDLPVAEQHVFVRFAVLVLPLGLVGGPGALPRIVDGPVFRVLAVARIAGDLVRLHIARVVGGDVPERPLLRLFPLLPVVVDLGDDGDHLLFGGFPPDAEFDGAAIILRIVHPCLLAAAVLAARVLEIIVGQRVGEVERIDAELQALADLVADVGVQVAAAGAPAYQVVPEVARVVAVERFALVVIGHAHCQRTVLEIQRGAVRGLGHRVHFDLAPRIADPLGAVERIDVRVAGQRAHAVERFGQEAERLLVGQFVALELLLAGVGVAAQRHRQVRVHAAARILEQRSQGRIGQAQRTEGDDLGVGDGGVGQVLLEHPGRQQAARLEVPLEARVQVFRLLRTQVRIARRGRVVELRVAVRALLVVGAVGQARALLLEVVDPGVGLRVAHARVDAQFALADLALEVGLHEARLDVFRRIKALRRREGGRRIVGVRIEVGIEVVAVPRAPGMGPAAADIEVRDRQGIGHPAAQAGRADLVQVRGGQRRAVTLVDTLAGGDIGQAGLQMAGPVAGQVVVPVGHHARLLALVGLLGPAGADGKTAPVIRIGIAGGRRDRRVHVVVAVVDGRLGAIDVAGQLAGGAGGRALIEAGLAGQRQLVVDLPAAVQGAVAECRFVLGVDGTRVVRGVGKGAGQQIGGRVDFHVHRYQAVVAVGAGGQVAVGGGGAAHQDAEDGFLARAVALALIFRTIEAVDARQQGLVDLLARVARQVGARVVVIEFDGEVALDGILAAVEGAVVATGGLEARARVHAARVRHTDQEAQLVPRVREQREAVRIVVLGVGVVGVGQAIADGALRIVERARGLQVHHAAHAAFGQFGQRRFIEVHAAEQFGREHVVVEAARGAADGGRGCRVDGRAVERRHRIIGGQAADRDALAFAGRLVAVEDHARHALQRFGDIRFREFADVLGHDGVAHADGLRLEVQRLLQAGSEAGDDHGFHLAWIGWRGIGGGDSGGGRDGCCCRCRCLTSGWPDIAGLLKTKSLGEHRATGEAEWSGRSRACGGNVTGVVSRRGLVHDQQIAMRRHVGVVLAAVLVTILVTERLQRFGSGVAIEHAVHALAVQRAHPAGDRHRAHGVADGVGDGARFGHEAVHAQQQHHAGHGDVAERRQRGGQRDETGAGDARRSLGRQHQHPQHHQLVGERERRVGGLGDEDGRHRVVDALAVRIEGHARRYHQPHHRFRHAHVFELAHQLRHHRFRRTGAQHREQFFLDITEELPQAEARHACHQSQHDGHEQEAGDVHGPHQLAQRHQRTEAVFADRESDGAKGGQRRHAHDHGHHQEHAVAEGVEKIHHRLGAAAQVRQRDAEHGGKHQDLQDVVLGQRVDDAGRDHVHHKTHEAVALAGCCRVAGDAGRVERLDVDVHAHAGLGHVDHHQPKQQRKGGHHLEVDQGAHAHATEFLHAFHLGDAQHHHGEDDGSEHHLDQADEGVAEGFQVGAQCGIKKAQQPAGDHADQDLDVQLAEKPFVHGADLRLRRVNNGDARASGGLALFGAQPRAHGGRYLRRGGHAAQVARVQRRVGGDRFHGRHHLFGGVQFPQVLEQHHHRPEGADRVGQALAHDVERGTVDRFEHRRIAALGIDVAGGGDTETAGQRGGQVAQDVRVQVGGDDGVERGGTVDHARGGGVHQLLVPCHVREFARDFQRNFIPHHHRVALGVALGDHGEQLARARLRQPEGVAQDALHAHARHHRDVGGRFDRVALVHAAAHARIFAFRVFAHDHPVQVFRLAALQGAVDAGQDAGRAHVGILVEALADFQAQAPQGDMVRDVRVAGGAEQDGVLVAQGVQAVGGHHHAVLAVVVAAPVEVFELEAERVAAGGQRGQHLLAGRDHFLADAVAGYGCDVVAGRIGFYRGARQRGQLERRCARAGHHHVGREQAPVADRGAGGRAAGKPHHAPHEHDAGRGRAARACAPHPGRDCRSRSAAHHVPGRADRAVAGERHAGLWSPAHRPGHFAVRAALSGGGRAVAAVSGPAAAHGRPVRRVHPLRRAARCARDRQAAGVQPPPAVRVPQGDEAYGLWRLYAARGAGRGAGRDAERAAEAVKVRGNLTTNDGEIAVNWALDGHGILMRAEWDIERYLDSGRLVQVLPGYKTPDADIYAVYAPRHQLSARIRTFVEFLGERFGRGE
uniref:HTH-type transcriptional regulator PtxR, putative n=1 Tax=Tanacetum cinerariifolium TaxID=118510 RepID=A0A699GG60_TANCI|nr:HTH-type transcriptional regulator PtxR, putative [Tanacetum cinerariifolium]